MVNHMTVEEHLSSMIGHREREPRTFDEAVSLYMDAVREYELSDGGVGYTLIEIPKLFIADRILNMLELPTAPQILRIKGGQSDGVAQRRIGISPTLRWETFKRDGYRCVLCAKDTDLTVDHIYPQSKGGDNNPDNLRTLCRSCNSRKGDRVPND